MRADIDIIEIGKTIKKTHNNTKSCSFGEKISKITKPRAKMTKKNKREDKSTNVRNEIENIVADLSAIKRIIMRYSNLTSYKN